MAKAESPLLVRCYRDIDRLVDLDMGEWDLLIRQGRRARLLGRLHALAEGAKLLDRVPEKPLNHLVAARVEADRVNAAARWEAGQVAYALERLAVPIVVLKGAAYALGNPMVAAGRTFSDLDILVPKGAIEEVERRLNAKGWLSTHLDDYDQRYYRQWMHEIPPMKHMTRKTNLDVHHGILPETVASRPDPRLLVQDAVAVDGVESLYLLSPVDRWLHSAAHLFQEGEFHNALRDLTDLDLLSRELGSQSSFWTALPIRARQLNLTRQLFYTVLFLEKLLGTPFPEGFTEEVAGYGPAKFTRLLMDRLYRQAFRPLHASCDTGFGPLGRYLLYIRSHAIRMPPHLLIPHLAYKAVGVPYKEWREGRKEKAAAA